MGELDRSGLEQMLRMAQRALAKSDPETYIELVLGHELAGHHKRMLAFARDIVENKKRGIILAPRGAGKTYVLNTGYLSWLIAKNPAIRIGLFSQKDSKAEAMSSAIQGIIDYSDDFKAMFGDLHGPKWTAGEWLVKGSPHVKSNNRTMVTGGAGQSSTAVSKRFDLLFFDDILDENNTATIDQREKIETWFWKSMMPTQAAEGAAVLVAGTRWVESDIFQRLIEDNKWPSLVIPALTTDEDTGVDTSYWPEVWPLERLYQERVDVGWDNFACSYLNDISGIRDGSIFRKEWFRESYFTELPPDRTYTFTIGIDLASSKKERADYTAGVFTARDDRGEHWVLWHQRAKIDSGYAAFVRSLYDWGVARGYRASLIVAENNQAQESVVVQMQHDEPDLPIVGRRADTDKTSRARGPAARYESRRVHHHIEIKGRELETEMLAFPKGHDDLVDALGNSMDLTSASGSIAAVNTKPRIDEGVPELPALGTEVIFRDGSRLIPAYLAAMMQGLPVETMTYDEAVASTNRHQLSGYIKSVLGGAIRR